MSKRPGISLRCTKQQRALRDYAWIVYRIAAKRKYVGRVNAPGEKTAIARVIEEYDVPPNERLKLIALRS